MKQTCIFILGMHRSGTSALGGVLEHLGVSMGKIQLEAHECNPKGFYENEEIVSFNDTKLFPFVVSSWNDVAAYADTDFQSTEAKVLSDEAKKLIASSYGDLEIFGIKDPRMCMLLPFWKNVLHEQNTEMKIILPFRNPMEVAHSLQRRDGYSLESGLLLWARYVLYAEFNSRGCERLFTSYEELLKDPETFIKNIEHRINIQFPISYVSIQKEISSFLEKDLKHHELQLSDLSSTLPDFIYKTAYAFHDLARGAMQDDDSVKAKFDEWRMEYENYTALFYNHTITDQLKGFETATSETARLKNMYEPELFAQLFLDQGNGITEENSLKLPVAQNTEIQEFIFDLSDKANITNLRLDPLNDCCVIEIEKLVLVQQDGGEVDLAPSISSNACIHHGKSYFFDTIDPIIHFSSVDFSGAQKFTATIRYPHIGRDALEVTVKQTKAELDQTIRELDQTKTELDQTKTELDQTKTELDQTKTELDQTKVELDQTKVELDQTLSSHSWRITKPLRKIKQIFKA